MASERVSESEIEIDENLSMDNKKKRKKKKSYTSDSSIEDNFMVGMVAVTQEDGIFKDPHEVGKFIGGKVGDVGYVKVTRGGMVVIQCKNKTQMDKALKIEVYLRNLCVKCFQLDGSVRTKGVINGVPVSFDEDRFSRVPGVCDVRRLSRFVNGERQYSASVCLTFIGELPEKVFLDYISYPVREFLRAPLRCYSCQEYGHVAAVCRGMRRCANCGKSDCKTCASVEVKCLHCDGDHRVGSFKCSRRQHEEEINRMRVSNKLSYAEALKRVRESRTQNTQKAPVEVQSKSLISVDKKFFLAFMAMVVNCSTAVKTKSEGIDMVLDAAKRFLKVQDITGEDLYQVIKGASQTNG